MFSRRNRYPRTVLLASVVALLSMVVMLTSATPNIGASFETGHAGGGDGETQVQPQQQGALGNPSNLTASASGNGGATLQWTAAANSNAHWIWSVQSNGTDEKWTQTTGTASSATITGLEANKTYWFNVVAAQSVGQGQVWSSFSNWASALIYSSTTPPTPGRYSQISAGVAHTCGVRQDGDIDCWGSDGLGQSSPPDGPFLAVSAGGFHTCGVKSDGTVACWGDAVSSPPATQKFVSVSSGLSHTCGLTAWPGGNANHKVICWGIAGLGRTEDFETSRQIESITAGYNHNCVTYSGSTIRCWGSNESGQNASGHAAPEGVSPGGDHTCWLKTNGTIQCLGDNTSAQSSPPGPTESDFDQEAYTYTAVSAGDSHTCAIDSDGNTVQAAGNVRCWGSNLAGQSSPPSGVFQAVSAGLSHTCGLRHDGLPVCWGDNSYGQAPR